MDKRVGRKTQKKALLGMVVGFILLKQFSVDFVTSVCMCVRRILPLTRLSLSLKVWGMREVVYNEMNLHGEVFTVNVSLSSVREEDVSCSP